MKHIAENSTEITLESVFVTILSLIVHSITSEKINQGKKPHVSHEEKTSE